MTPSQPVSAGPTPLRLTPEPGAARRARQWAAGLLSDWPEAQVETARLLVSELVTNAALHARTPIVVRCRRDKARAVFEVDDGRIGGPHPKRFALDSPTGRGMRLVASLANDWGVRRAGGGKTIWFSLILTGPLASPVDATSLAADLRGIAAPAAESQGATLAVGGETVDVVDVVALALPLEVYLEAEQHNDAITRELTLIVRSAGSERGLDVPVRLLELAEVVQATFSAASDDLRAQVEAAIVQRTPTVDIHVSVPRQGWEALLRLAEWLDEVDRYCEEGNLLTLASPPRLRRFRSWYANQVAAQMRGEPPTPWEGTPRS